MNFCWACAGAAPRKPAIAKAAARQSVFSSWAFLVKVERQLAEGRRRGGTRAAGSGQGRAGPQTATHPPKMAKLGTKWFLPALRISRGYRNTLWIPWVRGGRCGAIRCSSARFIRALTMHSRLHRTGCPTWIDATGRLHSPAGADARIVSLVPSLTELVFDLGLGERLVGAPASAYTRAGLRAVPKVSPGRDVNLARIRGSRARMSSSTWTRTAARPSTRSPPSCPTSSSSSQHPGTTSSSSRCSAASSALTPPPPGSPTARSARRGRGVARGARRRARALPDLARSPG